MKRLILTVALLLIFIVPRSWGGEYVGDFATSDTIYYLWSTNNANGASANRSAVGTIKVYKANSVTEIVTNGVTDTSNFDSTAGLNLLTIDLDNPDYTTGAEYNVAVTGATIDSQTVNAAICSFSIENRFMRGTNSAALASSIPANFDQSDWSATGTLENTNITEVNGAPASSIDSNVKFWADTTVTLSSVYNLPEVDAKAISDSTGAAAGVQANIGKLDVAISALNDITASDVTTDMDANSTQLAAILLDTGTTLDDLVDDLETRLTAARAGYLDELAAANLPTDVADIPTVAEFNARTLLAAEYATAAAQTTAQADLDDPAQYKATGFSTHNAAAVWSAGSRELSTPASYKADVSGLALQTSVAGLPTSFTLQDAAIAALNDLSAADVWGYTTRTITAGGGGGTTPALVWAYGTRALSTPAPTASAVATAVGALVIDGTTSLLTTLQRLMSVTVNTNATSGTDPRVVVTKNVAGDTTVTTQSITTTGRTTTFP